MSNTKRVAIAEAVIDLAVKLGAEQDLRLGEVIGHLEIAKMELYSRNLAMAKRSQAQAASEPSEGGDTVEQVDASQSEAEDTVEK